MRVSINSFSGDAGLCDLTVVPFGVIGEIDYKKELGGETKELVKLGHLSKKQGNACLFCAPSDNHGLKRLSAFLFEKGRLSSIFDVNDGSGKYSPSYGVGTFNVNGVKAGVLIGDDGFDCDLVKALSLCGCSAIIDIYPDFCNEKRENAACFFSYAFGIDYLSVGTDKTICCVAGGKKNTGGKFGGTEIYELPCKRLYREIKMKKPGSR